MILFTALGGTIKYLAVGRLPWRFLLWFGSIGVLGGQTGQRLVKKLIVRTGRPSIVVFLLGTIIALAVIIMATMGIVNGVKARDAEIGRDRTRSGEIGRDRTRSDEMGRDRTRSDEVGRDGTR